MERSAVRTLHLVVRNRWEEFVVEETRRAGEPAPYPECLERLAEAALSRLLDRFRRRMAEPGGVEEIHRLFEEHGAAASEPGPDRQRLSAVLEEMILARVHTFGAESPELDSFAARQEREIALLRGAGPEDEREFLLKKSCWLTIQRELEDKLLLREEIRLKNFNVTMEWMALFGPLYIELLEAQARCHQLERRIAIRRGSPSLSDEEIEERVKAAMAEELASLKKVQGDAQHAAALARLATQGEFLSGERVESYREEARRLMREIWRLTHPDTVDAAFTERQRDKLREYLEQVVEIRRSEAHLDVRAISVLSDILGKVKDLYAVMGIDLEPSSVIQGDTIAEQTTWLEGEIRKIESQIQELMAEIQAMSLDPDIREKMASMDGEETREATLLGLQRLKEELDERNAALQAAHQRMIDGRGAPAAS